MKSLLKDSLKIMILSMIMIVVYFAASAILLPTATVSTTPEDAGAVLPGVLVMILVNMLILTLIVKQASWRGPGAGPDLRLLWGAYLCRPDRGSGLPDQAGRGDWQRRCAADRDAR